VNIRMNADKKQETTGFPLVPDGDYLLKIRKVTDGSASQQSKNPGCEKIQAIIDIIDEATDEKVGSLVTTVTFIPEGKAGHGIWLHFNHAFGMPYDGEVDFNTQDYVGQTSRGRIYTDTYNGKKSNKIGELYVADGEEPAGSPSGSGGGSESGGGSSADLEEVPF